MGRQRAALPLAAFVALTVAQGCAAHLRPPRHPDFKARHALLHTLSILPPDVEVYKLTFKGDREMMYDLLPLVRQRAVASLKQTLKNRGYEVRPFSLTDQALEADPELRRSLHTVQELFDKRLQEFRKHPMRKFEYAVGPEVNVFAERDQSDALVMVRCYGIKKTGGEIAEDIAQTVLLAAATLGSVVMVQAPSATVVQMAVVDGNTGDLLWYTDNADGEWYDIAREKSLKSTVRKLISRFPKAPRPSKPSASQTTPAPPPPVPVGYPTKP